MFDLNNFDPESPPEEIIVEEEIEVEPPPPSFSTEELEAAKMMAFENGRQKGADEEKQVREQRTSETLQQISTNLASILAAESYREKQYEQESLKLALEIIEQLIPPLHLIVGKDSLRNILSETIKEQSKQSEIIVKVHPDNATDIDNMIEGLWDENTSGRFKVVADSDTDIGGCELSWEDGGMVRDPNKAAKEMKNSILALLLNDQKIDISSQKPQEIRDETNVGLTAAPNNDIKEEEVFDSNEESSAQTEDGDSN